MGGLIHLVHVEGTGYVTLETGFDLGDIRVLYLFPRAVLINYNKLGGLIQPKFNLSQFWRLESQSECWQGHALSPNFHLLPAVFRIPWFATT